LRRLKPTLRRLAMLFSGSETLALRRRLAGKLLGEGEQRLRSLPVAEIAERFVWLAGLLEEQEDRQERGHDLVRGHQVLVDEVEPVPQESAAEKDCVLVGRLAHEADVRVVGAGAAI